MYYTTQILNHLITPSKKNNKSKYLVKPIPYFDFIIFVLDTEETDSGSISEFS